MAKRTTITNAAGTFYARREKGGQFKELDEKGRSLAADRRTKARTTVEPGYGDEGDQERASRRPPSGTSTSTTAASSRRARPAAKKAPAKKK